MLTFSMCSHYISANRDRLAEHFGVDPRDYIFKPETYPGYLAPVIRLSVDNPASGQLEVAPAMFGMVPHWADIKLARQTYNSRSETTATKPAFRNAFKRRQFCIIPADAIYEPCYESGKAVRWQIRHVDDRPMGIAGIWETKSDGPEGRPLISFSMLTINADGHSLMQRFHKPDDEKRSVVFLHPDQYESWIHASIEEAPNFFTLYPADELVAFPAPNVAAVPKQGGLDLG